MANLPPDCEPYDLMIASILDSVVDEIPPETVHDLCVIAQDPEQFYVGMQATVELWDIVKDHSAQGGPYVKPLPSPEDFDDEGYRFKDDWDPGEEDDGLEDA